VAGIGVRTLMLGDRARPAVALKRCLEAEGLTVNWTTCLRPLSRQPEPPYGKDAGHTVFHAVKHRPRTATALVG
jgi:hypothetical protein